MFALWLGVIRRPRYLLLDQTKKLITIVQNVGRRLSIMPEEKSPDEKGPEEKVVMVKREDLLQLVSAEQGLSGVGMDTFKLLFVDGNVVPHMTVLGCKPNYRDYIMKAFNRFIVVALPPKPEENIEAEKPNPDTPPDLRPTEDGEAIPV